jgi:hypothetical protein
MTTRELRTFIRQATPYINQQYLTIGVEPAELKKDYPLLDYQREKLIQLGTGKEYKGGIGMGLTYKTKPELVAQARALAEAMRLFDSGTEIMTTETAEKENRAYNTFLRNRPGMEMSETEFHNFVETLGAIGKHIFDEFGYEDFIEVYDEAIQNGKNQRDILQAVASARRSMKEDDTTAWTTEAMIDLLRGELLDDQV